MFCFNKDLASVSLDSRCLFFVCERIICCSRTSLYSNRSTKPMMMRMKAIVPKWYWFAASERNEQLCSSLCAGFRDGLLPLSIRFLIHRKISSCDRDHHTLTLFVRSFEHRNSRHIVVPIYLLVNSCDASYQRLDSRPEVALVFSQACTGPYVEPLGKLVINVNDKFERCRSFPLLNDFLSDSRYFESALWKLPFRLIVHMNGSWLQSRLQTWS